MNPINNIKKLLNFPVLSDKEFIFVRELIQIAWYSARVDSTLFLGEKKVESIPSVDELKRLSDPELSQLARYLKRMGKGVSSNICNDLPDNACNVFTKTEWIPLQKDYHDFNGDPEEFTGKFEHYMLMDFMWMAYFSHKIDKGLNR